MPINNNFTRLTNVINRINNPAGTTGVLIEEIPCDMGRTWQGYKRGGLIEGSEKLRKELMGAAVWIFGIPAFNKIGNVICEKFLKIPTIIDYSNAQEGNDAIKDSVEFLTKGTLKNNELDVSELKKYGDKFKGTDSAQLIKKVAKAKQITSIAALILNCLMMGIILPKINQAITRKKIKQQENKDSILKSDSMEEFINKTKPAQDVAFKGALGALASKITYGIENSNTFRLISTDVPMIGGRVATSRNRFEGFENFLIDFGSIFFYNFSKGLTEKGLRKITSTPDINPAALELISKVDEKTLKSAFSNLENNPKNIFELFQDKELQKAIYKEATYGKYGKINKFVKNSELEQINKNVINFMNFAKAKSNGVFDREKLEQIIKTTKAKNGVFMGIGLLFSIVGLAVIVPKTTYAIIHKITGKNTFTGITDYNKKEEE